MRQVAAFLFAAFMLAGLAPSAPGLAAPAAPVEGALSIPFEAARGLILIEIEIGGERVPAVYDSGASVSILNSAYPRRAVFARIGKRSIVGFGGRREGDLLRDVRMTVGERQLRWKTLLETDLREFEAAFGRPLAAIIGVDAFGDDIITIDREAHRIQFSPRKRFVPPAGVQHLPFAPRDHPLTNIAIAGRPLEAVVDTGSNSAIKISAAMGRTLGIDSSAGWGGISSGAGGIQQERTGLLPTVQFAGVTLRNVPVEVAESEAGPSGIGIGAEILSRFRLHMDYAGNRLWAEPYADAASRPFDLPVLGAATRRGEPDRLTVVFISEHSPADEAGLAPGDEIVAVDGRPVADLPAHYAPAELREPGPITFTLADGRSITVQRRPLDVVFQPARAE